jgi:hypothetical protein
VPKDEDTCEKYYPIEGFLGDRRFFNDNGNLTRSARAGIAMAKSIIEMVNLMYQNNTAEFLVALNGLIVDELNRRTIKKMEEEHKNVQIEETFKKFHKDLAKKVQKEVK